MRQGNSALPAIILQLSENPAKQARQKLEAQAQKDRAAYRQALINNARNVKGTWVPTPSGPYRIMVMQLV